MRRFLKQLVIASIFIGLGIGVIVIAWNMLYTPTCFDRIKNGSETGVDCGGSCPSCELKTVSMPVVLRSVKFSDITGNVVDTGIQLRNPNASWGAKQFSYTINFYGAADSLIPASLHGTSFLLPGQTRWIMETAKFVPGRVERVEFAIATQTIAWAKLKPYIEETDFTIQNTALRKLISPASGYAELIGRISNKSQFDAKDFEIQAVVYDAKKQIVAIGNTMMKSLRQGETRDFRIFWQRAFDGQDASFDTFVNVNVLQDSNFLQKYEY